MNKSFADMGHIETTKIDIAESCLNNIGLYIIQKIREEDLREVKYTLNINEPKEAEKILEEEAKSKIDISEMILNNKDILINLEDFYEEDCQLSLLNWAFDLHKRFRQQRYLNTSLTLDYYEKINKDLNYKKNSLNNNLEILLFNILNIFEIFPIKPDDLKSLNFIGKLTKIKKDMKTQNIIIYKKIKNLIKFWKSMIKLFEKHRKSKTKIKDQKALNINLNRKRPREDDENAQKEKHKNLCEIREDNEIISSNLSSSIYETDSCEQNELKKKNVSWKNDDIMVDKIVFDPNEAPSRKST